ncbi:tetratricopeptide repeat-containing sulfotransferase family protein [Sulfitobacter sp. S190]|uniref:tetratricopeptide repeat-containing sulfotransferase family protein n=1 Tax=Sulfitobacter sp. S190 TaxID=2867022 RepID=UPI0021A81927|nr:tetratricopeptide repeat-containing sulfotransferase family protein [Sulfitobacter sp. S190]UWR21510.1 sulfotransferase [Sulfitobacter sp. S190]
MPANDPYAAHRPAITRLMAQGAWRPALARILAQFERTGPGAALLDDMARCYWGLHDTDTALKLATAVAQDLGNDTAAWAKLGAMAVSVGDTGRAKTAFEAAVQADPKNIRALAALYRLEPFGRDSRRANTLRRLSKSRSTDAALRATALNTLAQIEEAANRPRSAFYLYGKSKRLGAGHHDTAGLDAGLAAQIAQCPVFAPATEPPDGPVPIFVVGMPRSGTTLMESVLACHAEVCAAGESTALESTFAMWQGTEGSDDGWSWVDTLDPAQAAALGAQYRARIAAQAPIGDHRFFVDKTPLNVFRLGFARRILPQARFIFMSRHPLDTGLSNYATPFAGAYPHAKAPADIAHMTRTVYATGRDLRGKLGAALRWQSYSALVTEPEAQIRACVAHAGLSWDPACLAPQNRRGVIRTASVVQVRREITPDGQGRWTRFADELAPMRTALGGDDWIAQWEAEDAQAAAQDGPAARMIAAQL